MEMKKNLTAEQRDKRRECEESLLTKIPILGYFFRRIQKNRELIETALKTEKKTEGEVEKESFLGGLITIVFGKSINTLKLRGKKLKKKRK